MNVNKKQTGLLLIPAVAISSIIAGKKVFDKYKLRKKCKNKEISKKEKEELNNFLELTMNISNFVKENEDKLISIKREDSYAKLLWQFGQITQIKEILENDLDSNITDAVSYIEHQLINAQKYRKYMHYKEINNMIVAFLWTYIGLEEYVRLLQKLKTDKEMFKTLEYKKSELTDRIILLINENHNLTDKYNNENLNLIKPKGGE